MTRDPIHAGEILLHEFLEPTGMGVDALARACNLSPKTLDDLIGGHVDVTPEIAAALSRVFGTSEAFWLNLPRASPGERGASFRDRVEAVMLARGRARRPGKAGRSY